MSFSSGGLDQRDNGFYDLGAGGWRQLVQVGKEVHFPFLGASSSWPAGGCGDGDFASVLHFDQNLEKPQCGRTRLDG